jgi:hypothetical protein
MSFLKRFLRKRKIKGKVVYDLDAREVGEISSIRYDRETRVYDVLTRDTKFKLSFPADQFFTDEAGRIYLLPKWSYHVRVSCSKLLKLRKRYEELSFLINAMSRKTYLKHLRDMTKSGIPCGEEIIQHLPRFEEYLMKLKGEKTEVVNETSRLMTLRLLEFGREANKSASELLTKKKYSLRIIDLRRRYRNISRLIRFVSELYEDTKASLVFLKELLGRVDAQREVYPSVAPEIQDLMKRANNVCIKGKEITEILDGLIEAVITV